MKIDCKCWIFIYFILSLNHRQLSAQDLPANRFFDQGQMCISNGDTSGAIEAFSKALDNDRKSAEAHHALARLYLGLGGLQNRINAQWALEAALATQPENVAILETQLALYMCNEYYRSANRTIEKILKGDPENITALLALARIYEEDYFYFQDLTSVQTADPPPEARGLGTIALGTFQIQNIANRDLYHSIDLYTRIIKFDPEHSEAYYRMAALFHDAERYDLMAQLLDSALKIDPDNKDYTLFMGLALHKQRRFADALAYYEKAISMMEEEELTVFENVDMIVSQKEMKAGLKKTDSFQKIAWKKRDPLFLTDLN